MTDNCVQLFTDSCVQKFFDNCVQLLTDNCVELFADSWVQLFTDNSVQLFTDSCVQQITDNCVQPFTDNCVQVAAEIAAPLSQAKKITMVSMGKGDVGAAKLTGEVVEVMERLPKMVEGLTGVNIAKVCLSNLLFSMLMYFSDQWW